MILLAEMSRQRDEYFRAFIWGFLSRLPRRNSIIVKHVNFSYVTQIFNDFGVFLYLFARKALL